VTKLLYRGLTDTIIGVYWDVYNGLSRIYPEYIYERAMMDELRRRDVHCRRQPEYEIYYRDKLVGRQRLDLFVADEVVVELKVAPELTKLHKAQTISYLKVVDKSVALLLNFGAEPGFERLYYAPRRARDPGKTSLRLPSDWPDPLLSPELTYSVVGGLMQVHTTLGPGLIHRIYANATYHELQLRGFEVLPHREYQVFFQGRPIGGIKFNHLQVGSSLLVFPVAIQNLSALHIDDFKSWMRSLGTPLAILANFYPERLDWRVLRI
jgi:GxxExxY protein